VLPAVNIVTPLPPNTIIEWVTLDEIQCEALRAGTAYWNKLRCGRPWPSRDELNFRDMAKFLPYMALLRVIDGGADFEHRFVGDVMVRAFSVPIQNRRFSEIGVDAPSLIRNSFLIFRRVLQTRAPVFALQRIGHDVREVVYMYGERALLPLGCTSDSIDYVIGLGYNQKYVQPRPARPTSG